MFNSITANLLINRPNSTIDASIISKNQIKIILSILDSILNQNISGDIVEFGCYVGESSKYLRMMLDHHLSTKQLHVYDSFDGLPPLSKYEENTGWRPGTLKTSEDILKSNFTQNGLKIPIIHKGWFNKLSSSDVPNIISFGFLDGDFYDSIFDSLSITYPKLSDGGCILFHDYQRPDLPGVEAAIKNYMSNYNSESYVLFKAYDQLGALIKLES